MAKERLTSEQKRQRREEIEEATKGNPSKIELLRHSRQNGTGNGETADVTGFDSIEVGVDVKRVFANDPTAAIVVHLEGRKDSGYDWESLDSAKFTKPDKAKFAGDLDEISEIRAYWEVAGTGTAFELEIIGKASTSDDDESE